MRLVSSTPHGQSRPAAPFPACRGEPGARCLRAAALHAKEPEHSCICAAWWASPGIQLRRTGAAAGPQPTGTNFQVKRLTGIVSLAHAIHLRAFAKRSQRDGSWSRREHWVGRDAGWAQMILRSRLLHHGAPLSSVPPRPRGPAGPAGGTLAGRASEGVTS